MDFLDLPEAKRLRLMNLRAPGPLLGRPGDLVATDLTIEDGRIVENDARADEVEIDMGGRIIFPCFIDAHTHIDKGHIWARSPNPDGTFMGALETVGDDRRARWTAEDVRRRADFALRCAWAHGTKAVRTHLDSSPPQEDVSWPVFRELREDWAGCIDLQAVSLTGIDFVGDTPAWRDLAQVVKGSGGVLGAVTYPVADIDRRLDIFFETAGTLGLDADFHVDETMDPNSATLRAIARAVGRTGFTGKVNCGHCCSLSTQEESVALETLDYCAGAGLSITSLPMCNMYLQDRRNGRTPRGRGVTLVHEARARGIPVIFASDNTRDPFYAYGDLDMLEVMREATRICHLDHSREDWAEAFLTAPAAACGFETPSLDPGAPADLVICRARSWTELFARPQSDRMVLRAGRAIDRALPDYAELDDLMEPA
ncbi:cytosine deaminase [Albimonas donghaensis]|uniref:Cytosine deaminase n=1 Tax=Albimonas donghaensis TaxID=356660 RepID=A0A1H2RG99_9RHOB|nr:cytosine deaminase [Albimonas donghaensis]